VKLTAAGAVAVAVDAEDDALRVDDAEPPNIPDITAAPASFAVSVGSDQRDSIVCRSESWS
jgi:hypothetical protein